MRTCGGTLLLLALGLVSQPAAAQTNVEIDYNPEVFQLLEEDLGLSADEVDELINDQLRELYGLVDVPTFLRLSANAQSMANKGLGVDYASSFDNLIIGGTVSVAVDAGDGSIEDLTDLAVPVGAGAQIALMVGYQVDDRLRVYLNGLYHPLSASGLEGDFYNVGVHLQYNAVAPVGKRRLARWGGLDVTTGFELSRMRLELPVAEAFEASGAISGDIDLDTVSTGTLELEQRAITVPLELTTNVTLLYFLTLYTGIGVDLQLGQARMNFDLNSDLSVSDPETGQPLDLGDAEITVDDRNGPDLGMFRILLGFQLNIWRLKVFGQVNFLTNDLAVSLAAGLRIVL